tara:strand:- start:5764 stop:5997 length:234 start_codon:yes stop_codon:yes gene_type:complete
VWVCGRSLGKNYEAQGTYLRALKATHVDVSLGRHTLELLEQLASKIKQRHSLVLMKWQSGSLKKSKLTFILLSVCID